MLFGESKVLSLNDLFERIKKARKEKTLIVKSDTPVKAHEKQVGGHVVHVGPYSQHRKDAASQVIDTPGPQAHLNKQPEATKLGGVVKLTVNPNKPVSCPMCHTNVGQKIPSQGEKDSFQYKAPNNPIEGKEHHEISLDDIAQAVHHGKLLKRPEFDALSAEEKKKHLKNHAFIHLTPDAKTALHREIKKIVRPRFESVGRWMQLHRLGTQYDPETLVDDFTHRIIDEMTTHRRAGQKHGYKKEEDYLKNPSPGEAPEFHYHQGMDTSNVHSAKDLAREARIRTPWWAKRYFFKEANNKGFEHLIGGEKGPAFQQSQLLGKIYKTERKADELKKQAGLTTSDTKIDTSVPYSLQDLQQIAKKTGYLLEKETSPDGNVQRVLVFEEDPSVLQSVGADPKYATPKFEVDFGKGGKISEVRDKLAKLVNPSEAGVNTPLHKFIGLSDELRESKAKAKEFQKQHSIAKEKYERFSEGPEIHQKRISQLASDVITTVEDLEKTLPPVEQNKLQEVAIGINSAMEYLEDGDFKEAFSEIGKAKLAGNSIKPSHKEMAPVKQLVESLLSFSKESEYYHIKKTMNPNEREKRMDQLFDAMKDSEEQVNQYSEKNQNLSMQLAEMKDDPQIQQYSDLQSQIDNLHSQLEQIKPQAEKHWQESLEKINAGDDEAIGDYSDDAQVKKWKETQKHNPEEEDIDWEEKIPQDVDLNDEEKATEMGKNILSALKHKQHGAFIFGGQGYKKGLLHIANHLARNLFDSGNLKTEIEDILAKNPEKGETPEFFKENGMLASQNRWKRIHKLDPDVSAKYALVFSDYNPMPYSVPDIYENSEGLFDDLFEHLAAKGYEMPNNPKTAEWQYYQMFRLLGNHAIEQALKNKPDQKAIFEKIRDLNRPNTPKANESSRYPGKLRRQLERRMDVLYGRYAKDFPGWKHDYKEPLKNWLTKIGVQPEEYEKSLTININKLNKAQVVRLVVNRF
jgi:hypothetical protein